DSQWIRSGCLLRDGLLRRARDALLSRPDHLERRQQDHQPATLKEHNASGVTGCLKNLAYGTFNNVDRTHAKTKTYTDPVIAIMCTAGPIRSKAVLNIMDGIRAVYHSGPFAWNPEFVWEAKTLLFGT